MLRDPARLPPDPSSPDRWDRAIGAIYDSVLTGGDWTEVLAVATAMVGATTAHALFREAAPGTGFAGGVVWNTDPAGHADYVENWHDRDPRYAGFRARGPGALVADHDVVTQAEIDGHPLYREFLPAYGLKYALIVNLPLGVEGDVDIGFLRDGRRGPYEAADKARLRRLAGHLERAALLGRRLRGGTLLQDTLAATLDRHADACLLVDADGRIVVRNAAAARLLDDPATGLRAPGGVLGHRHAAGRAALARRIREACLAPLARVGEGGAGATVTLPVPEGGVPLVATVVPLATDAATRRPGRRRLALVTVAAPRRPARRQATEALRRHYGLSPSEAEVAVAIADGCPPKEIARRRAVAPSTVRSQLADIFRKTGVGRQPELAALVGRLGALVGSAEAAERPR